MFPVLHALRFHSSILVFPFQAMRYPPKAYRKDFESLEASYTCLCSSEHFTIDLLPPPFLLPSIHPSLPPFTLLLSLSPSFSLPHSSSFPPSLRIVRRGNNRTWNELRRSQKRTRKNFHSNQTIPTTIITSLPMWLFLYNSLGFMYMYMACVHSQYIPG